MSCEISVRSYSIRHDFDKVREEWTSLCRTGKPSFFLSWEWVENWIKTLPENVAVFLMVMSGPNIPKIAFFVGSPVATISDFYLKKMFLNATGIPSFDEIFIEYNKMLVEEDFSLPFLSVLSSIPFDWDEFVMPALESEFFNNNLFEKPSLRYKYNVIVQRVCSPFVDLDKVRTVDFDYLSLLSSNTRSQVRRSYRFYEKERAVDLQVASTVNEAMDILSEMISLHHKSWQKRGKTGCFANDYLKEFHKRFVEQYFSCGNIQLARLSCGESTLGCVYNFVHNDTVYYYQSGLRVESDNKAKPGLMLHSEIIRYNAKKNFRIYDFLAGGSQYKNSLSTDDKELVWVKLQKKKSKVYIYNSAKSAYIKMKSIYN